MNKRDAAAEKLWAKHSRQSVSPVYVVGDKGTAGREVVGCLKFVIIVLVLIPMLIALAAGLWLLVTA